MTHSSSYPVNLCSSTHFTPVSSTQATPRPPNGDVRPGYFLIPPSSSYTSALSSASSTANNPSSIRPIIYQAPAIAPRPLHYVQTQSAAEMDVAHLPHPMSIQDPGYADQHVAVPPAFNSVVPRSKHYPEPHSIRSNGSDLSYRLPYSPVARQLAAELDELRRAEFQQQQQQHHHQHNPPPPANLIYNPEHSYFTPPSYAAMGSLSLPRSLHIKVGR